MLVEFFSKFQCMSKIISLSTNSYCCFNIKVQFVVSLKEWDTRSFFFRVGAMKHAPSHQRKKKVRVPWFLFSFHGTKIEGNTKKTRWFCPWDNGTKLIQLNVAVASGKLPSRKLPPPPENCPLEKLPPRKIAPINFDQH